MDKVTLAATRRNPQEERARDIRDNKRIPVELYGKGEENISLSVDYQAFRKAYMAAGQSMIVELVIDEKEKKNVMIHDVDFHPVRDTITHADLQLVRMKEKVRTFVPLQFEGVSPAVKNLGGVLNEAMEEIEIECLPTDLLHHIVVDITVLEGLQDSIQIKDLAIAKDSRYEILDDLEATICSISAPMDDAAEDEAAAMDASAVPTERELQQKEKENA